MRRGLPALRILAAACVGCLFTVALLGPAVPFLSLLAATLPRLQVGPALYRLLVASGQTAALVLAVVGLVSLVAGRLYCAAWCPLGVLQDAIRFLLRRLPLVRRWQDRPAKVRQPPSHRKLVIRWAVLATTVVAALSGAGGLAGVLEPYSAFGRIVRELAGPTAHAGLAVLAAGLERVDVYALTASPLPVTPALVLGFTAVFLSVLAILAALGGRLYCTTICPVGTGLGLLARAAPVRVRFDPEACTRCGLCARRCRADCIRIDAGTVQLDQAACVACMDCLAACPVGAVHYGLVRRAASSAGPPAPGGPAGRRELLVAGSAAAVTVLAMPLRRLAPTALDAAADAGPVSPPGSGSREHFVQSCTACQLCVGVCPTRVLKPAVFEYGVAGIMQPRLSFLDGFCEYDCERCVAVCPNGALRWLSLAEKQRTQLGVAKLYKDRCIVYCRGEECGACAEVCPTRAVHTQERDNLLYPEMAQGACIGCGACEYACPENPKAIVVQASAVHGRAAPPYVPETPAPPADGLPRRGAPAASSDFPF